MLFVQSELLPEQVKQSKKEKAKEPHRYVCAACRTPVSDASRKVVIQGESPYHFFANPEGILFEILTLSWCQNLRDGSPSIWQDTWFAGYAWTVQYCSGCQMHMGWRYDGPSEPNRFYGIVRQRLVEAGSEGSSSG